MVVIRGLSGYIVSAMDKKPPSPFHVHLAVDGSEHAMAATQLINDLSLPRNSRVTILGVVSAGQSLYESKLRAALMQAERILGRTAVEEERFSQRQGASWQLRVTRQKASFWMVTPPRKSWRILNYEG
jgi:hypothetical protein